MDAKDVEWALLVAYARAAGAPDAGTACSWAEAVFATRALRLDWRGACEEVDWIARRYLA